MNTLPDSFPSLMPYFAVSDGAGAMEFYKLAFGATELYRLVDPQSGKIGHAEMMLNDHVIMLSDEYPQHCPTPQTLGGTTMRLCLMVDDVDASVERARAAGATVTMEPKDQFYGHRSAQVRDPFGHEWLLQHEIERVLPDEMQRRWDAMVAGGAQCEPAES
ncbi:MAG: VOC family protein [Verrucomicrobiaceae bacterium]